MSYCVFCIVKKSSVNASKKINTISVAHGILFKHFLYSLVIRQAHAFPPQSLTQ